MPRAVATRLPDAALAVDDPFRACRKLYRSTDLGDGHAPPPERRTPTSEPGPRGDFPLGSGFPHSNGAPVWPRQCCAGWFRSTWNRLITLAMQNHACDAVITLIIWNHRAWGGLPRAAGANPRRSASSSQAFGHPAFAAG